jgi:hypothetical protein
MLITPWTLISCVRFEFPAAVRTVFPSCMIVTFSGRNFTDVSEKNKPPCVLSYLLRLYSIVKMETINFSQTSINFHCTTRRNIPGKNSSLEFLNSAFIHSFVL